MVVDSLSSATIVKDLEEIYHMALEKGNFAVALKAKELLGRELGLFGLKGSSIPQNKVSLNDLSNEDILHLIEELEAKLKLDHSKSEE